MENIEFIFTPEQQRIVAEHYGRKPEHLYDWEICELLDELLSDVSMGVIK